MSTQPLTRVTAEDVADIALGGAFLATGGGGDTLIGEIMAEAALTRHGPVTLVAVDDLAPDAVVAALGSVGSPTIMQEKPSNGRESAWALDALEATLGKKVDALIAFEAGGVNALAPFFAAAERGLPVVDADGMGRAFPELQMESFSIYGVSATPMAAAGEHGDTLIVPHARSSQVAERLVRHFAVVAGGGQCVSAEHVMSGAVVAEVAIPGTISLCRDIGRLIAAHGPRLEAFGQALAARLAPTHYGAVRDLMTGKVVSVERQVRGGYDFATVTLAPFARAAAPVTVDIKNEYLLATQEGRPLAMTPDLICLMDLETGRPITAETLRYGQRAHMLAIGAPALMRTPQALEVVGPRAFGFDCAYTPIETLAP